MAKKARQRISYVIPSAKTKASEGHTLGVSGLAVDAGNSILYSGGRDGLVCAWDLNLDLSRRTADDDDDASKPKSKSTTTFRAQTLAHAHWINDITLVQNGSAVVSASTDLTVKVWRPHSEEVNSTAIKIGEHKDFAKCVASPPASMNASWVASGGLDRKVFLWDLNGGGQTLEIDVKGEEMVEKGSVYSLAVGPNVLACGGPEKAVRLYDTRSGSKVSKLVGHTGNIKAILIDDAGDTILSASADKTIKMWSVKGGRCMYTFTMHDESVWSLFSDDPSLGVFYSTDRSGFIAKTDVRGSLEEVDYGVSVAVAQEHSGVIKVAAAGGHIWSATNQSSINRWEDVDISSDVQLPESFRHQRALSVASIRTRQSSIAQPSDPNKKEIPPQSILRISNTAAFPSRSALDPESATLSEGLPRKGSEAFVVDQAEVEIKPIHQLPTETIEGQFGLLKHKLLNDRRRVLTLDTAGDVLLWDLIECKSIQSFGKGHLEEVERTVNTREAVAPWCSVDLSSGNLTVVLEPFNCFDAEVYADELKLEEPVEFREDQRVSLGKWILRYLFANLIDEEIRRDEVYRAKLNESIEQKQALGRIDAPTSIPIPPNNLPQFETDQLTPRAVPPQLRVMTPGISIGQATPGIVTSLQGVPEQAVLSPLEKESSRTSADYFSTNISATEGQPRLSGTVTTPAAVDTTEARPSTDIPNGKGKDKALDSTKSPNNPFGKKFRMSFSTKKLGRSSSQVAQEKPVIVDEKAEESEESSTHEKEVEDNFLGVIQKIRNEYEKQILESPDKLVETRITPSLPSDTPVLKLPPGTKVIIQEETSGGNTNIYEGTVEGIGRDADIVEQKAPMWLGDMLLQNQIPLKDPVKISFVLHPMDDLPPISSDGNSRLNANRMLRVKKILAYVAERIEPEPEPESESEDKDQHEKENGAPESLKPEEYLDLYCNDQLLDPAMSLASLRTHVWKGGSDIVLHYKANGKKEIRPFKPPPVSTSMIPPDVPETPAHTSML